MRYTSTIIGGLAGLLILAGGSSAQAQSTDLTVVMPFGFTAGGKTLPPGRYEITRLGTTQDLLQIRGARGTALVLGNPTDFNSRIDMPSLVFDHYGDQYFLHEVRFAGRIDMSLPQTLAERQAILQRAELSTGDSNQVVVAAELR